MAFSLVNVDRNFNIVGEVARFDDLAGAMRRIRELEAAGSPVDLVDTDTARFVPVHQILAATRQEVTA